MTASTLAQRAAVHRVLGDEHRLAIVEELRRSDRSPSELGALLDLPSNLLAHHLRELEAVGLVRRVRSDGDARRRYLQLVADPPTTVVTSRLDAHHVLFVCSHNAARSQLAAALWRDHTGHPGESAGTEPSPRVDAGAVRVARAHGLDLGDARPRHLREVAAPVDLVVTVCDRAHEAGGWPDAPSRHWSVPDPVGGGRRDFERAFGLIQGRVERLVAEVGA